MFWPSSMGLAVIACLATMSINLAAGAYVYPMRPNSIDPLMFGIAGGGGVGGGAFGIGGGSGGGGGGRSGGPMLPKKRPFCNAFTGCGRKRSDPEMFIGSQQPAAMPLRTPPTPPSESEVSLSEELQNIAPDREQTNGGQQANQLDSFDDTLVDLLDLNSEPAIEDLMRQIMSQAKMWEAIQEANREMIMQKNNRNAMANEQSPRISFPTVAFNAQ